MKVYAISDLHLSTTVEKPMDVFGGCWENYLEEIFTSWQETVREEDVVLLCGDFSWAMRMEQAKSDFDLISKLAGKKVILRGNHDYWWNGYSKVLQALPKGFYAVQNNCLRFDRLLLCGSRGWLTPGTNGMTQEDNHIYKREVERLRLSLSAMQKMRKEDDVVIGLMHFPPFNGRYEDSDFVRLFVEYNVNTVVYGHLHGKDCRAELKLKKFGIDFFLTSCDLVSNKMVYVTEV